jgi:hypothetical protein
MIWAREIVITALGCINTLRGRKIGENIFPTSAPRFPKQHCFLKVLWFRAFSQEQNLHEDEYWVLVQWYGQEKIEELGAKPVPLPLCPPQF